MKRGEMGGGAIFGQNIWVNIAIILSLYFFSSIIGNALALNSWSTLYKVVKAWPGPEAY